jgi:hypothetical protein
LSAATAFLIVGGLAAAPALAQPDPTISTEGPPSSTVSPAPEAPKPSKPATPAEPVSAEQPDMALTAGVEPGTYVPGQNIPITVTITNAGPVEATGVQGSSTTVSGSEASVETSGWQELATAEGGTFAPGVPRNFELIATVRSIDKGNPVVKFTVESAGDSIWENNSSTVTIPLVSPEVKGTVGGIVFGDANENGAFDTGEGLADVELEVSGGPGLAEKGKTGVDGAFAFLDQPAGIYSLYSPSRAAGWILARPGQVVVDGSGKSSEVRIRGVRPLSDVLSAKIEFGAESYQVGALAKLDVTLTNRGPKTLSGIKAGCDRVGLSPAHVSGWTDPALWGELASPSTGVTLGAGETKVIPVSGGVQPGSLDQGVVYAACDFGDDETFLEGFPTASGHAKVPGKTSDIGGVVYQDLNGNDLFDFGEAVANAKFGLSERKNGPVVAETTTDFNGVAQFIRLPRGWYYPTVQSPWRLADPDAFLTNPVQADDHFAVQVVNEPSGDTPAPADPVVPADGGSGSGPGSVSGLASTGVEVFGPVAGGAAAVFAGILALFYARRLRRTRA